MGGLLHPMGPMPPHIYWVRRTVVLGLAAVILVTAWWVFLRSGNDPATTATIRTSVQTSNSPTPGATLSASGSLAAAAAASLAPSSAASPAGLSSSGAASSPSAHVSTTLSSPSSTPSVSPKACADNQVTVVARTDRTAYPAGVLPLLGIAVTNSSSTPCLRDVGQRANQLTLTSAGKRVWSSDDCNPGGSGQERLLQPGQTYKIDVQWTRLTSKTGCPPAQAANAGAYQLTARNGKINSQPQAFTLS